MSAAGYRVPQIFGADRDLALAAMSIAGMFALLCWALWAVVVGVAFWFCAIFVLQKLAVADPLMRQVLWRYVWYRRYYPPRSGIYARAPELALGWR